MEVSVDATILLSVANDSQGHQEAKIQFALVELISHPVDFFDPERVATAFKVGREPRADNVQCLSLAHRALSDRETIAVVVGAIPDGDLFVPAETAPHALHSIGDNGFTIARTTEDNPALYFAPCHGFRHGADEIRIIAGCIGICAEVANRMSVSEESRFDGFFVGETGMIRADGDRK
jgi:hypothetical protein